MWWGVFFKTLLQLVVKMSSAVSIEINLPDSQFLILPLEGRKQWLNPV